MLVGSRHYHKATSPSPAFPSLRFRKGRHVTQCLKIDRRMHMELAWKRQQEEENRLKSELANPKATGVVEVKSLAQHDAVLEEVGNSLVVVFFYSRSCGVCKEVLEGYKLLSDEYRKQSASIVFTKHNVIDEFDGRSDMSQMYQVRAVPSFGFFAGGALVTRFSMKDSRGVRDKSIKSELLKDRKRLSETLRELLFRVAPSAMR